MVARVLIFLRVIDQHINTMNTKHTKISGSEAHRVLIHYLLQEAIYQYNLISAKPTFEEDLLRRILAENERHLPDTRLNSASVRQWWRHVRFAIQAAGLNHYDLAQVLSGKGTKFDYTEFHKVMEENAALFI